MSFKPVKKSPIVKVRWIICGISFLLLFSLVSTKVCLSLAIVAMTDSGLDEETNVTAATMASGQNNLSTVIETRIPSKRYLNWTQSTNDQLMEASFIGAMISPIPSGRIAEKFGARKIAFVLGLVASATMLAFPLAAEWAFEAAFFIRVVQGLCVGCAFPCAHVLVSHWAPKYEKTLFASIINAGALLSNVVTHPLVGLLCSSNFLGGWPAVFYVIGTFNAVAAVAWIFVVFDDPETHPFISQAEKEEIIRERSLSAENSVRISLNELKILKRQKSLAALGHSSE